MSADMEFEFDPAKSASNQAKHGIDFEEAKALWDADLLELPARSDRGRRRLVIGKTGDQVWSAIVTYRNECVRLISVRRARDDEVKLYERR